MTTHASTGKPYLDARLKAVRTAIQKLNLDALLLTTPSDLAYLSDFTGDDSVGIVSQSDFILVTDFRYQEQAQIEAPWLSLVMRANKMSEAVAGALAGMKAKRVGFEGNRITFGEVRSLEKAIKENLKAAIELSSVDDLVINLRKVKDEREIGIIREAITIAQKAYTALLTRIKPGETESHLAAILVYEMQSLGASGPSFPPILAASANSSLPHYRPGADQVRRDQPLLIDWGAFFKGYCSDLTRTLLIGKVSEKVCTIYKIVLEAQKAAIAFLKPGVTTQQADRAARDVITKAGFGDQFGHGLGHGIGREIHELPALRKLGTEDVLQPGMVVTVEPGIYLPGIGGVRIEDDVLITPSGCQVLSNLDKSIEGNSLE